MRTHRNYFRSKTEACINQSTASTTPTTTTCLFISILFRLKSELSKIGGRHSASSELGARSNVPFLESIFSAVDFVFVFLHFVSYFASFSRINFCPYLDVTRSNESSDDCIFSVFGTTISIWLRHRNRPFPTIPMRNLCIEICVECSLSWTRESALAR